MFEPEPAATPHNSHPATAIYALTPQGAQLGRVLAQQLDGDLFVSKRLAGGNYGERDSFDSLPPFVGAQFKQYSRHVFVAAAGIAVRCIAPLLQGKDRDPAVVALDQRGRFVISLVSGHLGGANNLALEISKITAGQAIVTTATDTEDLPSLDVLAQERGLAIANLDMVKAVNIALLSGETVQIFDPQNWLRLAPEPGKEHPWTAHFRPVHDTMSWVEGLPGVWVDHKVITPGKDCLLLHPPCLAVGIGCKRGTPAQTILDCIRNVLSQAQLAPASVLALASITAKQDEEGLLEAAATLNKGLFFYEPGDLIGIPVPNPSERVQQLMGVPSVSEAAALNCTGAETLLVEKTACNGVTVAVAQVP
ncbi:cobalt-precorrin 5A hydrolase [Desulfovibrio ferrophilus]|uniref:Cobalamin (Vitamin B12) biosynthesis CbiG protein n=1 Tax=Desulfovibrio ferrophilus TaxID=241368 RepID=A0A2Z6B2F8_9BACT|nr:cobalt-precorrin 5A hydrolase [Desulfovibrio ferrophilus]BBD09694.1 cobalamin (Vitamin B12) biosynthesis CbiG protein [Desulfovibrio ferrophilus]